MQRLNAILTGKDDQVVRVKCIERGRIAKVFRCFEQDGRSFGSNEKKKCWSRRKSKAYSGPTTNR